MTRFQVLENAVVTRVRRLGRTSVAAAGPRFRLRRRGGRRERGLNSSCVVSFQKPLSALHWTPTVSPAAGLPPAAAHEIRKEAAPIMDAEAAPISAALVTS